VALDRLCPTLMHEHVFILDPGALASFGTHFGESYWDEEARVADAIAQLRALREAGIETIVDSLVAAAAVETGAPVMVHTHGAAQTGVPALETLVGHGVDPRRIVVAHAGDSNDLDYLRAIAESGASLGCDRFNIEHFNPDDDRIRTLVALVEAGYLDRIHLGHDAATFHDFMIGNPLFADEHPSYLHISTRILPRLLEAGLTQAQIDEILVANPRRFFA
jgi:phosphotriesterase-related protein